MMRHHPGVMSENHKRCSNIEFPYIKFCSAKTCKKWANELEIEEDSKGEVMAM